jgi:hypothetical protein
VAAADWWDVGDRRQLMFESFVVMSSTPEAWLPLGIHSANNQGDLA